MTSRAALAAPLLLQSPPGQLPNVYEDLSGLVASEGDAPHADEDEFKVQSIKVREEHNLQQQIVVELPNGKGKSILCQTAIHPNQPGRFLAPREKISFAVDHETLATSDLQPYIPNSTVESLRSHLEKYLSVYVEDRFATGLVDVFARSLPRQETTGEKEPVQETQKPAAEADEPMEDQQADGPVEDQQADGPVEDQLADSKEEEAVEDIGNEDREMGEAQGSPDEKAVGGDGPGEVEKVEKEDREEEGETQLVIHIVANRYKLSNFWSGRWCSTYTLESPSAPELGGQITVRIHYFEDGNVQLHSSKSEQLTIGDEKSDEARAKAIVRAIESFEAAYQEEMFNNCNELSEGAFRSLRRQLPMTKQKVDWDKVLNYKLGSELAE